MYLPTGKWSGKGITSQSCTCLWSIKCLVVITALWFLHFHFILAYLRDKAWQKVPLILREKKEFLQWHPRNQNNILVPLFWCDLYSLKSNLENPSTSKGERYFLRENNSSGLDTEGKGGKKGSKKKKSKKSIQKLYESWLDLENCLHTSKLSAQLWSKSRQKEWDLKNKKQCGRALMNRMQSCSSREKTATLGLGFHHNYVMQFRNRAQWFKKKIGCVQCKSLALLAQKNTPAASRN